MSADFCLLLSFTEKPTGLDTLGGDAVTAELFGIRRLMSCSPFCFHGE